MAKLIQTIFCAFISICLMPVFIHGQEYLRMIDEGSHKVSDVVESAEAYFQDKDKGRGSGYKQFKRWEYMSNRLMDEDGYLKSHDFYLQELEKFEAMQNEYKGSRAEESGFWTEMGPTYWNATTGWNPGVGRITAFSIDPEDENIMIIGAETGGIWKTEDGANTWAPLTDYFSNMRVYSTAIHPANKNIYYFGSNNGRMYKSLNAGATWQQIGTAGNSLVNKILIHPEDTELMFASVQNSGLYRSTNGGTNWTRITNDVNGFDFQFKADDNNVLFASGSTFHRSNDRGTTFTSFPVKYLLDIEAPLDLAGNYFAQENSFNPGYVPVPDQPNGIRAALALYMDPSGTNHLACAPPFNPEDLQGKVAVIRRGECLFVDKVVRAQEAGAVAVIIVNNVPGTLAMGGGNALVAIPAVNIDQEFGEGLISRLLEGEVIEVLLEKSTDNNFDNGPKMIGVSPDNPDIVYLLEARNSIFGGLYKSVDGGENFSKLDHGNNNYFGYNTEAQDNSGQAPRDMAIAVNPNDVNEVHIAGILSWMSEDGGESFTCTSDWVPSRAASKQIGYCHADVDIMEFYDSTLYAGTDGGIFRAVQTKNIEPNYYEDLTDGLGIRQFYKIGVSQTNPVIISGGSQDNGTSAYSEFDGWIDWLGADGMETFVDKTNENVIYGTSQYGTMYVTYNGGFNYSNLPKPGSERGNWVTPFEQDPIDENTIYLAYEQIFKSVDGGFVWEPISHEFSGKLHHFKIAPSNNRVMYAAYENTLYRTTTGTGDWQNVASFSGNISDISIHPGDANKLALAVAGSNNKVLISENGGNTWLNYGKNLPNFAALSLVWEANDFNGLYLGMNYGIFYIDDSMEEWIPFNNNIPNVIVNELEINYADGRLYAGTYGRGLWSSPLYAGSTSVQLSEVNSALKIYPNPAEKTFYISLEDYSETLPMDLRIYDASGRVVVFEKDIQNQTAEVNISHLMPGVYYARVSNSAGSFTRKLMVK